MPAYIRHSSALGAKLVTVFSSNAGAGLPTHLATILLFDSMTGELRAIVDGRFITEARTGAVSAVSTDLLANRDAHMLAVIGSGVQARSHVDAIRRVRDVQVIRAWSPDRNRLAAFVREMQPRTGGSVTACGSAREAVDGADIVVLATSARGLPDTLGLAPDGSRPGLLVPPGDPAAVAGALRRWLGEPTLRHRLRV